MVIATYGPRVFEVNPDKIYTFDGFAYSSALTYENQEVEGSKPSTYIKGEELDNISFTITVDSAFGVNPRHEWGYWKRMLKEKRTYPFILDGVPINNAQFLLTDLSVSDTNIIGKGHISRLTLEVKLQEYVRAGKKTEESTSNSTSTSNSPGLLSSYDETESLLSTSNNTTGVVAPKIATTLNKEAILKVGIAGPEISPALNKYAISKVVTTLDTKQKSYLKRGGELFASNDRYQ